MTRLRVAPRFKHKGVSTSIFLTVVVSAVIVALVVSALMIPSLTSSTAPNTNSGSKTNSNQTTTSTSSSQIQPASPTSASCVTVVPYDSIQKEFAGCGYTFSVLYNGAPGPLQTLPNGTEVMNLGWTLLIQVSQNCRCGPSQNVSVGWDPAGPGSSTSGERLPAPASSTLLNGNLTMEWRLYNSNVPLLYAWIIASSITSSSRQTTSATTTQTSCPASPWPSQVSTTYQSVVQQIEQNPSFIALTDGRCYSFALNDFGTSGGQSLTTFIFNQYNGTIFYPCGTFPANLTVSQIQVTVFNGTTTNEISSMWLNNQTASLNVYNCPLANTPVWVHSVLIVPPYTPAGPTVEVTLRANLEQAPITNLTAVLALTGRESFQPQTQTFRFLAVNASNPLLAGQLASQAETIVGPVTIFSDYLYSMNISGTFQNGQTFSYGVQVEIVNAPPSGAGSSGTSAASEECYSGALPTNSSGSDTQSTLSRTIFNITKEYDSWSWTSLSTFKVGSYTFVTTNPGATPGVTEMEPQLFFHVTDSQGQTQMTSVTNLGNWNGQVWPPDMSLQQTLFGGNAVIQWLFACNGHDVYLEVTTYGA